VSDDELIEDMAKIARMNHGQRVNSLDIRGCLGEANLFDAWAGAESYPTEGIVMFFKSVAYRRRLLYD
jgi:hypothetical protein